MTHVRMPAWVRSFIASNGVTITIDSFGDLRMYKGIGDPGITVPVEDISLILTVYDQPAPRTNSE